jgi:hypothetical protein
MDRKSGSVELCAVCLASQSVDAAVWRIEVDNYMSMYLYLCCVCTVHRAKEHCPVLYCTSWSRICQLFENAQRSFCPP